MGEHSLIIPETRVIDRESGSRVVCKLAREFTVCGLASSAGGVRRRGSSEREANPSSDERFVSVDSAEQCERRETNKCEKKDVKQRRKWRHPVISHSRGVVAASVITSLSRRLVCLLLSLVSLTRLSSSSVSTSRGSLLVSGSCALVSLLVVGLLRPCVAVPTNNAATAASSDNGDTTLTRIMLEQLEHANAVKGREEEANFESVVEATMNRRRRRVEDPTNDYDYDYEDSLLAPSFLQHPRESGLKSRSRLREAELDTIRRSIVEGLGLERIPDPSKANVSQTEYRRAHEEYLNKLQSRSSKDGRLRRLHTFHPAERSPVTLVNQTHRGSYGLADEKNREIPRNMHPGALYFPLEILEDDALIDHATLRLLVDTSDTSVDDQSHDISLYRLTVDSRQFVSKQSVPLRQRGPRWIELDATELASLWHEYGVENIGLELRFERSDTGRTLELPRISEPVLNVFTTTMSIEDNDIRNTRRKRRASPDPLMSLHKGRRTECRSDNKKCCRHKMTVTFKDLKGFEFIVQPKNFDAGYCKGRCPPRYNPAHHHALLQSLIWKEDKKKAPRPCCAPSKLEELEILYFDEHDETKLKVSSWKDMKVLECACS